MRRHPKLAVLVLVGLVAAACASPGDTTGPESSAGDSGASAPPASAVASAAPAASATPVSFKAIALEGSGDKVIKFTTPADSAAIATFAYAGSGNFVVTSLAADGSENDLLVNTIGAYSGTVLFDAQSGEHSVALKIEATGAWTGKIQPTSAAPVWNGKTKLTGKGDEAIRVSPAASGLTVLTVAGTGQGNLVVIGYSPDGQDLMVNEIGKYSGQVQLADGSFFLTIESDGPWTISPG
jgi:hypothetical protein